MNMRTPLKNARRLGSAKEGADHFWKQRVTAVANLILVVLVMWLVLSMAGSDHATVKTWFANPLVGIVFALLGISGAIHMRLGMQVIIEDYVHGEGVKVVSLMLNTFFAIFVGAAILFAVAKLSFGA
ncbi:MAG: succinate dehydrogenase, hydrophobic membrane anchor protein [Hyphomicrobiaceae bacterium]|nr:succinate dehydrogenase, hydrophobic membrane anchor protein [Hyphomicrobiaceae bacterium]